MTSKEPEPDDELKEFQSILKLQQERIARVEKDPTVTPKIMKREQRVLKAIETKIAQHQRAAKRTS